MGFREIIAEKTGVPVNHVTYKMAQQLADILLELEKGPSVDKTGGATVRLTERLWGDDCTTNQRIVVNGHVNKLVKMGVVQVERKGKRTMRIALAPGYTPTDEVRAEATRREVGIITHEQAEAVAPVLVEDDEADVLGARPGRLAARIEKTIPEIVSNAVQDAIDSRISLMLGALGYFQGVQDNGAAEALTNELQAAIESKERLATVNVQLQQELNQERAAGLAARTELNSILRTTAGGQPASTNGLMVAQLPKTFRDVGEWAMQNGFTVLRTRGGHLLWKHRLGGITYSASSPSDFRAADNLRRDLERAMNG